MDSIILFFVMGVAISEANPIWMNGKSYVPAAILRVDSPNGPYAYISEFNSNIGVPLSNFGLLTRSRNPQVYGTSSSSQNGGTFAPRVGTIGSSNPYVPYQSSASAYNRGFRRFGPVASSNDFESDFGVFPFAQFYNDGDFGIAATSTQNGGKAQYLSTFHTPKNQRGLGSSVAAVSTANGNGYSAASSSSSNYGNGFGSAISSNDGANYKAVILENDNNGRTGNTDHVIYKQFGTPTSSIQNGGSAQNLKGSSVAAVSFNNGIGYRAVSSAQSFGDGFAAAVSSTNGNHGLYRDGFKRNTVQIIQRETSPKRDHINSGLASGVSLTYSNGLSNGFEHRTITSGNKSGSGIASSVSATQKSDGSKRQNLNSGSASAASSTYSNGPNIGFEQKTITSDNKRSGIGSSLSTEHKNNSSKRHNLNSGSVLAVSSTYSNGPSNGLHRTITSGNKSGSGIGSSLSTVHKSDGSKGQNINSGSAAAVSSTYSNGPSNGLHRTITSGNKSGSGIGSSLSTVHKSDGSKGQNINSGSAAAVSLTYSNRPSTGFEHKAIAPGNKFGSGIGSSVSTVHKSDGSKGQNFNSGSASATSSTYSNGPSNGFEHKTVIADKKFGSAIVFALHNDEGTKYKVADPVAKNNSASIAPATTTSTGSITSHRVHFGTAYSQNDGPINNPRVYGSSASVVSSIDKVGLRTALSTAESLTGSGSAVSYAHSNDSANKGTGHKVAVVNAVNPISGLKSVVSSTGSDGMNYKITVTANDKDSRGNTSHVTQQSPTGSVHSKAYGYSIKGL